MNAVPDRYRSRKSIVPASRAPGWSSVGMIRAMAASTVARWWASKKVSDSAGVLTMVLSCRSRDQQRSQGAVGDVEAGADLRVGAAPDGVLVLDGQDAVEAALVQRVHDALPVDLAQARHPVAPPADVPGVGARDRPARPAEAVAAL